MTWLDWTGLAVITGLCLLFLFGCRAAVRRARREADRSEGAERRVKTMLSGFNDKLEGEKR